MNDEDSKTDDLNMDADIFREQMSGVKPIKSTNRISIKKPPRPVFISDNQAEFEDTAIEDIFSDAPIYEECPDRLEFARSGIQHNVLKRLRQGKFAIEHDLDLHGLTVAQARQELISFLNDCDMMECRHVIIVHGKGYGSKERPVIKPMVNRWLRVAPTVLAFHSALPEDGGTGAVYVLLKKSKQ